MSTYDPSTPLQDPERDLATLSAKDPGAALVAEASNAIHHVRAKIAAARLRSIGTPATGLGHRPFPVVPWVTVLHPKAEPVLRHWIQTVIACLQTIVRRYPNDQDLQEFLNVPADLHGWVVRQAYPEHQCVDICRLDLLGDNLGTIRVLEFNASSPGGVISTGMVNRFWRGSPMGNLLDTWGLPEAPFEKRYWFADWLIGMGKARGIPPSDLQRIGILHPRMSTRFELDQVHAQLIGRGHVPVDLEPGNCPEVEQLKLGYLKYIPQGPGEIRNWETFCSRTTRGDLVMPNPPGVRWIAENKLCLAVLSDPRFRHLFTSAQQKVLDALVPRSRKLGDGITPVEAAADRAQLVLKAPYGARGERVVIGEETPHSAWVEMITGVEHRGWLLQERVRTRPVETEHGCYLRDLVAPAIGGRVIGYGSRMNQSSLLNGSRGGVSPAVFAPHPL